EAGWRGGVGIGVPGLARRVGLSTSQLTRRVRALTGMSPAAYLIRERIGHACAQLAETERSVGEIADALGYADPSYFVRQFQAVMKTTPARYRRKELSEAERRVPGTLGSGSGGGGIIPAVPRGSGPGPSRRGA
ncbi:MAG TPA: helix-turn-helix transcriptional regulator, partial [Candidatus Methylacidiphilales bacterium]